MVVIYNIYIFDRHCECIFYNEWNRLNAPLGAGGDSYSRRSSEGNQPTAVGRESTSTQTAMSPTNMQSMRPSGLTVASNGSGTLATEAGRPSTESNTGNKQLLPNTALSEEAKLVYGVVFSTRNIINKLNGKESLAGGNQGGFMSFTTNTYRLHYYEAPTGLKIVLTTDPATTTMQVMMEMIYKNIYVEYVIKNPLFRPNPKKSAPIDNDYFRAVLNNYVREISSSLSVQAN